MRIRNNWWLFIGIALLWCMPGIVRAASVNVRIEGPANTILQESVTVPDGCTVLPSATTTPAVISGKKAVCALQTLQEQGRLTYETTNSNFGLFLNRVNGTACATNEFWLIYLNNVAAQVGIADLNLVQGDELLLTYGAWPMTPLAITVSSSSLRIGSTTTLTAAIYNESGVLTPWTGQTTFYLGGTTSSSPNGTVVWPPETNASVSVWAEATGKTRSKKNAITVLPAPVIQTTPIVQPPSPVSAEDITATVNKILTYGKSQQDASGKIIDANTSDWMAMSFGANGQYTADIKNVSSSLEEYLLSFPVNASTDINVCAGYARHVLGLLSAGISATHATTTALIAKMTGPDCYANQRYGPDNGINDDVFALLALLATGKNPTDPMVMDMVSSTIANQRPSGSFTYGFGDDAADLTGAAISALKYAEQKGVSVAPIVFSNAKQSLRSSQLSDGGWGYVNTSDVLTTSWVMMGINALGETQSQWATSTGKTPWQPLVSQLLPAGYYTSSYSPIDWFATKHAAPALLGKSWPIALLPRTASATPAQRQNGSSGQSFSSSESKLSPPPPTTPSTTATSTLIISPVLTASTTLAVTSTEAIAPPATSIGQGGPTPEALAELEAFFASRTEEQKNTPASRLVARPPLRSGAGAPVSSAGRENTKTQKTLESNATNSQQLAINILPTDLQTDIIAPADPGSQTTQSSARKVFGMATAMAGTLGAYLAWRFVQTLV